MQRGLFVLVCGLWLMAACSEAVRVGATRQALTGAPGASSVFDLTLPVLPPPSAATPLYLEVWARVRGSANGSLEREMSLHAGDRIGLQARTSCNAHVLLLFCDQNAMLSVFPVEGALAFRADQRVPLPAAGIDIRLGAEVGRESLYVVASRAPLAQADPRLHAALSSERVNTARSCGPALEALLGGALPTPPNGVRAALRGVDVSDAYRSVARAFAAEAGVVVVGFPFGHR